MIVAAAAAVLTFVSAPPVAAAAPASVDAYPTSDFYIEGYDGSYFSGTVTWYNRSVGVAGIYNAVGCTRVYMAALDGRRVLDERSTSLHCNKVTLENIPLSANVPGGADRVYIDIRNEHGILLDWTNCWRATMLCD